MEKKLERSEEQTFAVLPTRDRVVPSFFSKTATTYLY